jgi:hypothetical protein
VAAIGFALSNPVTSPDRVLQLVCLVGLALESSLEQRKYNCNQDYPNQGLSHS